MKEFKFEYMLIKNGIVTNSAKMTLEEIEQTSPNNFRYDMLDKDEIVVKREFTGFYDKNNQELYKDDIVRKADCEDDFVSIVDCEDDLYKITWWEKKFKYGLEYIGNDKTSWQEEELSEFDFLDLELVGNIYENPELLN